MKDVLKRSWLDVTVIVLGVLAVTLRVMANDPDAGVVALLMTSVSGFCTGISMARITDRLAEARRTGR